MTTSAGVCSTCGTALPAGAAFCLSCGKPTGLPPQEPEPAVIDKLKAALEGRYAVERELGKGGMATVYLAQDVRHERMVAIKVLHPELAASVGADRFIREIRVAAKLQHPHILTLYDSGDADGLLYYVMPFVQGESLRDKLDREKMLGVEEAIGLTIEVAEALGYAHDQGIVHRDIKPENILLSNGHALVADFGIARAVSAAEEHKLTQTGSAVGTPLYMSPEQAMGDEVGPTSDLYSLGCMAFELLTGQPPFTGANARAIMARHTMEPPPSIRLVRDTVPEEVEDAVLWALAKQPADRPKTAAAFIEILATPLGGVSGARRSPMLSRMTTAPRITQIRRAEELQRKRRWIGVAVAAAVVVTGVGSWLALRGRGGAAATSTDGLDPRTIAVLYFDDNSPSGDLGYLADGLSEELRGSLREVSALRVISQGGAEQVRGSDLPVDSIARLLGAGTVVRGSVAPDGGDVRVNVELLDGSGAEIGRSSFRRPAGEALALRDSLASEVAGLVRKRLGEEIRLSELRAKTRDVEAWVLLQRAERKRRQFDSLAAAGDTLAAWRSWKEADSLLVTAAGHDSRWIEPRTERGRLAYARSRLAVDDPVAAERWIATGMVLADSALGFDSRDPDALELRGNLRYWKWLLQLERDPGRAATLLTGAKQDLELATQVRPSQAGAWASLSHLYNQTGTSTDVKRAAFEALRADAFLSNADVVTQRLFYASYDDGDVVGARDACASGARRFPANPRFALCRLMMMTMRGDSADPARARRLADSVVALSPAAQQAYARLEGSMWTAAILARAGRADSARTLARRSVGDPVVDPSRDLANIAAFVYTLLGDTTQALEQLNTYLAVNPARREAYASNAGWWFRSLEGTAGYRRLVGTAQP